MAPTYTLAIMAGGNSRRMGTNKALLKIGQQTIIERIITQTQSIDWHSKLIITNTPDDYQFLGLPMIADILADTGALGGIYTALHQSQTSHTMIIACDMPFVSDAIIQVMMRHQKNYSAVIPKIDGVPQGLHGLYSKGCLEIMQTQIKAGQLRVVDFLHQVNVTYLTEDDLTNHDSRLALMNLNTPEDLAIARRYC